MAGLGNVYVTGSGGFVGRNLLDYLSGTDIQIVKVDRQSLRNIENLVLSPESVVVHLAGKAHDLRRTADFQEYYQVNYELTKSLYESFLTSGAKKFIFISSVKASADTVPGVLSEGDTPNPRTHYGKSKLMAEEYIQSRALPPGKSYYILRPCMIHGPGNKGNLNLLYQFVSKGIPYPLAAFENRRSFLSIDNLCFVIKSILERENIPSGIYQVADDESLSTNELVRIIARESGRSARLWKLSPRLIGILARFGDRFRLPLNSERLTKLTENYLVSNVKLKEVFKIDLPVEAEEGIIKTVRSFDK
jgi:nucleoside-diphosphate-sugar epimerase